MVLSSIVRKILGSEPPEGFNYELFLDENGQKISKSKGNGITIDQWLTYASEESLALYMYQSPKKAKKLYFDVIPKAVDEYYTHLAKFEGQDQKTQFQNPVWHIHQGRPPGVDLPVNFALLLNLVGVAGTDEKDKLWGYVSAYAKGAMPDTHPELDRLIGYALAYYKDFIAPHKHYRAPTEQERQAMADLEARLAAQPVDADAETLQHEVFEAGKAAEFDNLRDWFKGLYEVLLGQPQGPRMGSFIALYGIEETRAMLKRAASSSRA